MNSKALIYFILLAVLIVGCASKVVKNGDDALPEPSDVSAKFFTKGPSDKDLFDEALLYLSNKEKEPNYIEAKTRLENLVGQYPKSQWTAAALSLINHLEKISSLEAKLKQEKQRAQTDHGKLLKDIEGLKDNIRQNEDRNSAELTRLQQENEQLKNDIQQLKKLEVQLEKREKMLR